MLSRLRPQAVTDARSQTAGTPHALRRHVHADGHRFEMTQARALVEDKGSAQAAVNNDANAFDGERSLGNRSGKHHLPFSFCRRHDGATLLCRREIAIEREDRDSLSCTFLQHLGASHYLALSGEEDKDVTFLLLQGTSDGARCCLRHVLAVGIFLGIQNLDGVHSPMTFQKRCLQRLTNGRGINCGRHHQKPQVGAQYLLRLSAERQGEVGMKAPLVELVEDNNTHALKRRVALEHSCQDAFGQDLYSGVLAYTRLEADTIAHRLADRFAEQFRHAFRYLPCCQPSRFEHQYLSRNRCIKEEREGQQRRFACTRRSCDDNGLMLPKRPAHRVGNRPNRQFS